MENSLLAALGAANIAGGLAILAVLVMRIPVRGLLGARLAYALWLIVPAAAAAALLPARTIVQTVAAPAAVAVVQVPRFPATIQASPAPPSPLGPANPVPAAPASPSLSRVLLAVWLGGVLAWLARIAVAQRRAVARFGFITTDAADARMARATRPGVGPALVGAFRPRLVVPADFESRFGERERAMVLAHEQTHLAAGHVWINALVMLASALCWFNPLVHLGAAYARVDQELACDAAVVERFPGERRTYAEALIKTQVDMVALPLGCSWPVASPNLLMERIEMLARPTPGRRRLVTGAGAVAALTLAAGLAGWAAQASVVKVTYAQVSTVARAEPEPGGVNDPSAARRNLADVTQAAAGTRDLAAPAQPAPAALQTPTEPTSPAGALAGGDLYRAARLGATAADIIRREQSQGRLTELDPQAAVVAIGTDGAVLNAYPLRPLPPLPGVSTAESGPTLSLGGTRPGNGFSGEPCGAFTLGPGAERAERACPPGAPRP